MVNMLPAPVYYPAFNITRASHVVLTVTDLKASIAFYRDVVGLVVSVQTADTAYLRGVSEACHHSLVLIQSKQEPSCLRLGMRVFTENELEAAERYFSEAQLPTAWVERPYQGRTLHVQDNNGLPLELCATMKTERRLYMDFQDFKGGAAQRFDHYQILVPDVDAATQFYTALGFRVSEYMATTDRVTATFMYRKGESQDIVFFSGPGPRIHHFAYTVGESHDIFRSCDIAGNLGYGHTVERGPQRHGPVGVLFVYFRDPDGHRVELFATHYQTIDIEIEPVRWDLSDPGIALRWGLPAQASWFNEATAFAGVPIKKPASGGEPMTLEKYLFQKKREPV
jgi:catechol 2,3-dioxygenase